MIKEGSWWLKSVSDPRWDCYGSGMVGGFEVPQGATSKMEELKKELEEEPPDDLEFGYMKD